MNERISAMDASNPGRAPNPGVATPAGSGGFVAGLFSGQKIPALAAKIGASIGSLLGRPIRIGNKVIAARHADVLDLLARDLDFRIAPVNETKINAVNGGPFVLGMDRGCRLALEREALYRALAEVDLAPIRQAAAAEAEQRLDTSGAAIDVVNGYARPIAAHTAERLFGIGPGLDFALFMDVARAVFQHTFLNQSDDKDVAARALRAAALMRQWFEAEIAERRASGDYGADMMGALMRNTWLDDDTVRRTLGGMLVGSIDTTASSVAKIVATLASDKVLAAHVATDVDNPERLAGWCRETMRHWPHNPIVIRQAIADTVFNTVEVKKGDQIIAWTQAAMLDPTVFPSPGLLRPDRPSAHYLHFGGGLHPCAGRIINDFQIPLLVGALVRRGIVSADPIAWAGPFPDHLAIQLKGAGS
jgi:cytochrome P450